MDQNQTAKQMIDFNKTTFDSTFNAMVLLQDQAEKLMFDYLEKATWFPEEGKKAINEWVTSYKKARENFKKSYDENYKKIADYFINFPKENIAAKTNKKQQ
ncbi:MAG: hypothetical protein ABFD75_15345 [Smithella sp.]